VVESLHILAAAIWLAALVMGGVVAAIIFSTTPTLDPSLGRFDAYPGDHANLLAGYIQNRVFLFGDVMQFVGGALSLATMLGLILFFRFPTRRIGGAARLVLLCAAISVLSYHLLVLQPRMATNLRTFYALAESGQVEEAESAREAFMQDHPTASNVHKALFVLVLGVLVAGVWSATAPPVREPSSRRKGGSA
jgi:tetrahydromethanopterin S-methyltransferase subunit B